MNPIGRYLLGSFSYAAVFFVVDRTLWPGGRTAAAASGFSVVWGLVMQALFIRRKRLEAQGKAPYPPVFYFGSGLLGLGLCAACWASSTARPTPAELLALLCGGAFSLYLLSCGFAGARRGRRPDVGSGI